MCTEKRATIAAARAPIHAQPPASLHTMQPLSVRMRTPCAIARHIAARVRGEVRSETRLRRPGVWHRPQGFISERRALTIQLEANVVRLYGLNP